MLLRRYEVRWGFDGLPPDGVDRVKRFFTRAGAEFEVGIMILTHQDRIAEAYTADTTEIRRDLAKRWWAQLTDLRTTKTTGYRYRG